MRAEYLSHVGAVRENNEDAVYCDVKNGVFIVADGIGGKEAGEVASATAVRIVAEKSWSDKESDPAVTLREAFYEANDFLYHKGKKPNLEGMGTTLTAAAIRGDHITIVHVGDSRAYLINDNGIRKLTQDHSLVAQLLREGQITEEEARNHPHRNILLRSIGQEPLVELDTVETDWQKGDYLLLCTDGLYNMVDEKEMQVTTMRVAELRTVVEFLAEAAFKRGGFDNISLVVVAHD
ncbi:MAG: Stp1/IreP family PP2C-type Ser/Thr phosphatase [Clostridia bacterium]|nr:Stp1/IreP family PP2C-type Ser/Thr phosphatase [Clostridia bacterium]